MAVAVRGLAELQRAFRAADRHLAEDMRDTLIEAAAPVRSAAQLKATVLGAGKDWSRMRVGAYRSAVYVAPVERGARRYTRRRPRFGDRLLEQAMQPALTENIATVERRLDALVGEVVNVWDRGV